MKTVQRSEKVMSITGEETYSLRNETLYSLRSHCDLKRGESLAHDILARLRYLIESKP